MTQQYDTTLRIGTGAFIRNVCETLKDMADVFFAPDAETPATPLPENCMTVIAQFFGAVHGEYRISTTEFTAARIAGKYTPGASADAIAAFRDIYSDMLCEVLNVSAHISLTGLEKKFGKLQLLPPAWVYGEYHTVDYISGIGIVKGIQGAIRCSLVLNMAYVHSNSTTDPM